jgi:16S rRNA (cytosine967-C5)-methyltransferase
MASSARDVVLARLDRVRLPGLKPRQIPQHVKVVDDLLPRDAALAEALYLTTVKSLLPLRNRLVHHSGKPLKAIDPLVVKILLIGAAQLVHMDRIPPAVAVDQAVEQCRRFGRHKSAGLVNAVLRNFGRQPPPEVDANDPELGLSFPRDAWSKLVELFGPAKATELARHANTEPPVILRVSEGVDERALREAAEDTEGLEFEPHEQPGMLVVRNAKRPAIAGWAEIGLAQPQDPTAALVAKVAELSPGLSVLDRCAGAGTKTLQFHAMTKGETHAVEPNPSRVRALKSVLKWRALTGVQVHQAAELSQIAGLPESFDRVLVDVPCSNSGVFARRAEARYHQGADELASVTRLQSQLLSDSAERVKAGGLLIYSTCSIYPEENGKRVEAFVKADGRFVLRAERQTLPGGADAPAKYRDGGYVAVLVRDR